MSAATPLRTPGDAIRLLDEELVALASGGAWWPAERTLIVADLHFEKGSSFARRGALIPPYDTAATLHRLAAAIAATDPVRVISLGDAFHDGFGPERMSEEDRARLAALRSGREWIWIAGNHDSEARGDVGGVRVEEIAIGALTFRHEPRRGATGEIAGHLHPAARVRVAAGTVRRHCFAGDGRRLILPAFGAYAGGLDVTGRAFAGLFETARLTVHLIGEERVHRFPAESIVGARISPGGTARPRASRS
ncbi:MAG: ligase-associated DNA damage response endonuclease PdeM [Siculibacillus sp.]|nr:ligase-associated DNA damage response endonuclease PdeM [Siculibacillus sp.]